MKATVTTDDLLALEAMKPERKKRSPGIEFDHDAYAEIMERKSAGKGYRLTIEPGNCVARDWLFGQRCGGGVRRGRFPGEESGIQSLDDPNGIEEILFYGEEYDL